MIGKGWWRRYEIEGEEGEDEKVSRASHAKEDDLMPWMSLFLFLFFGGGDDGR
jgi:hypothetical protein